MKIKIFYTILIAIIFSGCSDYLDLVPEKDMLSVDAIFEKKNTALEFLNSCYNSLAPGVGDVLYDPAICGADEFMSGENVKSLSFSSWGKSYIPSFKIAEGLQNPSNPILPIWGSRSNICKTPHSNKYLSIRYCNTFINNVDKVYNMTDDEKSLYKAQAKAMKAYYYYELIKFYGPIVLVPDNIDVKSDVEDMKSARSHIDTCFKKVVELFDEAIPYLQAFKDQTVDRYGYFNKEAAYALKAKALLYAASPLYNGNGWYSNFSNKEGKPLFNTNVDLGKWEKAAKAIDEAIAYCESEGKGLFSNSTEEPTELLNNMTNIQYSVIPRDWVSNEMLYGIWNEKQDYEFKLKLPRYNPSNENYNNEIKGCLNPTLRMVELFYTENGLPINMDKTWHYEDRYKMGIEKSNDYDGVVALNEPVLNLHLKREARFYADIAADKCYWRRGWDKVKMNPYKGGDHGNYEDKLKEGAYQNLTGYWCKKFVPKEIQGGRRPSLGYGFPFSAIRMADLYLMQAEAWNEFSGATVKAYSPLNKVRKRAGIPTVQESWNNYSKVPGKVATKEGLREIIQQERMIEMAFEGHRFWDLRRWKKAHEYQNEPIKGWNVFGEESKSFYNNYEGPIVIWNKNKFQTPRDYFWPLKDEEILISNVKQNLGW